MGITSYTTQYHETTNIQNTVSTVSDMWQGIGLLCLTLALRLPVPRAWQHLECMHLIANRAHHTDTAVV